MDDGGPLYWMTFAQQLLIALVLHVSIGVYASYYLIRSLSSHADKRGWKVIVGSNSEFIVPDSPRDIPITGLVVFAILGVAAVPIFLLLVYPICKLHKGARDAFYRSLMGGDRFRWL